MTDSLSQVLPGFGPSEPGRDGYGPQGRSGRSQAGRDRKRKRKKRRRSIVVLLVTLLVVGAGVGGAYVGLAPLVQKLNEPDDYTGAGTTAVTVKVPAGASGRSIAGLLASAGVVKTQQAFLDAWNANPKSGQVQPGTYTLKKQMASASALGLLLDPAARKTLTVTIPEGMRAEEIYTLLAKQIRLSRATLRRVALSGEIGLPEAAGGRPEGFLFPATYSFQPDVTEAEALTAMVTRAMQAYTDAGVSGGQLKEIAIKASIIQAEAGKKADMGPISRVLVNRLRINMPLGLDTTISYATNRFDITTTPRDRKIDSPYNTYERTGLPAGPISNPGEDAIKAALRPTPGPWFYFVAVNPDKGITKFAVTKAQHDDNVQEFRLWLASK